MTKESIVKLGLAQRARYTIHFVFYLFSILLSRALDPMSTFQIIGSGFFLSTVVYLGVDLFTTWIRALLKEYAFPDLLKSSFEQFVYLLLFISIGLLAILSQWAMIESCLGFPLWLGAAFGGVFYQLGIGSFIENRRIAASQINPWREQNLNN